MRLRRSPLGSSSGGGGSVPDATTGVKGRAVILGGTADNPTVPWSAITGIPAGLGTGRSGVAGARLRAALASRNAGPRVLVFAGSSTTFGNNATTSARRYVNMFTATLQARYPLYSGSSPATVTLSAAVATPPSSAGVQAVNAGVVGTDASNYLNSTTRGQIAALNPVAIIHMVGSNDYSAGTSAATYKTTVQTQIAGLRALLTGPCVHILAQSYQRLDVDTPTVVWSAYGAALAEIANEDAHGDVVYVDISLPYIQSGIPGADPLDLIDTDGIHQRDAGHAVMADALADALTELLSRDLDVRSWPDTTAALTNTVAPAITGTASMAQTLTASTGTWSPTPDSFAYQWKRAGTNISGATASTYQVASADVGQAVTVAVTATKSGYTNGTTTSSSVTPTAGTFTNSTLPTITGTATEGQTLTAGNGTWSQTPDSYTYVWKRDGTNISGATASTYLLVTGDVGTAITVAVTAVKAGYTSVSATSSATSSVAAASAGTITNSVLPTITGTATEGQTLTAGNGTWNTTPDSYTYVWNRGGTPISGATASTYVLVTADVGNTITVAVTAVKSGWTSGSATSAATGTVAAAGGGVTTLASDDFNRANTTTLGSTPVGSKAWTTSGTPWAITSNVLDPPNDSFAYAYVDVGSADYEVTATLAAIASVPSDSGGGIAVRVASGGSLYWFSTRANSSTSGLAFYRNSGGTQVGSTTTGVQCVAGDVLKVRVEGSTITGYRNGTQVAQYTSATQNATSTLVGFQGHANGTATRWDDITITAL
jgi:lysophospholipase L1-like esterase